MPAEDLKLEILAYLIFRLPSTHEKSGNTSLEVGINSHSDRIQSPRGCCLNV